MVIGKPVHIVVATPGRLSELLDDDDVLSFRDMSRLKFLVVDEADRMMEDGHFPEVSVVVDRYDDDDDDDNDDDDDDEDDEDDGDDGDDDDDDDDDDVYDNDDDDNNNNER